MVMKKHAVELGMKFGRLTVVRLSKKRGVRNRKIYACRCECGNVKDVPRNSLASGNTRSCGCLFVERSLEGNTTHGLSHSPIYKTWVEMHRRCRTTDPKTSTHYLNRGITVCSEWKDFKTFHYDMIGTWKPGLSIDRKNNNLGYSKSNCRWASFKEQMRNMSRNRLIEHDGKIKTASEWAETYGMKANTLFGRLYRGRSVDASLTTPVRHKHETCVVL